MLDEALSGLVERNDVLVIIKPHGSVSWDGAQGVRSLLPKVWHKVRFFHRVFIYTYWSSLERIRIQ